ncbi:MAG: class I SAM-dependent methyltransferase [Chloroflexi bacterium]|nr:class I SAM-dependent methyltransferase [Chloroflexota bacterium]
MFVREARLNSFQAFHARAAEYDTWYDSEAGAAIFAMELDCLRPFLHQQRRPYLEIGVGSGRFAQALGIECGLDPSPALLRMAVSRGTQVVKAVGEKLPFADGAFGGVLIALTLCFVDDPAKVLREARRVLVPGGGLVLGLILEGSPWAEFYASKGRQGHPLYSRARFFSRRQVEDLLQLAGFHALDYCSILFQMPGQRLYSPERSVSGYCKAAGFVAIDSCKRDI